MCDACAVVRSLPGATHPPNVCRRRTLSLKSDRVDIVAAAWSNDAFRREILTGEHEQVVVMTIPPGGEIGEEVHPDTDQLLSFIDGRGEAELEGQTSEVGPNDLVFVRAGMRHNFRNTGDSPLRLITVYAPPEHSPGTVHQTKAEADLAERAGRGGRHKNGPIGTWQRSSGSVPSSRLTDRSARGPRRSPLDGIPGAATDDRRTSGISGRGRRRTRRGSDARRGEQDREHQGGHGRGGPSGDLTAHTIDLPSRCFITGTPRRADTSASRTRCAVSVRLAQRHPPRHHPGTRVGYARPLRRARLGSSTDREVGRPRARAGIGAWRAPICRQSGGCQPLCARVWPGCTTTSRIIKRWTADASRSPRPLPCRR